MNQAALIVAIKKFGVDMYILYILAVTVLS